VVGGRVLGALDVQSVRPAAFTDEDTAVMQLAADQVAVAVDNARKFSREATLLEATSPLFAVSRRLAQVITTEQAAQAIIDSVANTEADGCAVARFNFSPDGEVETIAFLGSWSRTGVSRFPSGTPLPASTSMLPVPMMDRFWAVADVLEEAQMPVDMRQALARFGARAVVNVPLRAGGRVIGVVIVQRATPGPFSPVSLRLYETLAEQAAVVLERARLVEETQRRAAQERVVGEVTARMHQTLDVDAVLDTAVDEIARVFGLAALDLRLGMTIPEVSAPEAEYSGTANPEERSPVAASPALPGQGDRREKTERQGKRQDGDSE
jgi:GAF domain-containing protein